MGLLHNGPRQGDIPIGSHGLAPPPCYFGSIGGGAFLTRKEQRVNVRSGRLIAGAGSIMLENS